MSETQPFFSIVTATLNRAGFLGAAIDSVLAQEFADFEHLVIDGGSTDATPALLARYPHLRVVSEPDRGLYDAINKGLRMARGKFVGFLNSDDLYAPRVFSRVARLGGECDLVSGGAHVFADEGRVLRDVLTPREIALHLRNVLDGVPLLNARFFRRSFIDRVGGFDLAFRVSSDREWLFRATLTAPREVVVPELFYRYRQHAGSLTFHDTDRGVIAFREEHAGFAEKHLASPALPSDVRRQLRGYHARESSTVAAYHWKNGHADEVGGWIKRGCAQNSLWPFFFARRIVGQALGR